MKSFLQKQSKNLEVILFLIAEITIVEIVYFIL